MKIDTLQAEDWPEVSRIYAQGLETRLATFETQVPTWEAWDRSHLAECRLVARDASGVVAWAALSAVSSRCVYEGVAEVSVYVAEQARGRGAGKMLLRALIDASEEAGYWTLQASIFPENQASVILHKMCGFRIVGRRERLGQLDGVWRDVLFLERRSIITGVDW